MIFTATAADASQIKDITARAGVFNQDEIDSVPAMFDEYLKYGALRRLSKIFIQSVMI